MTPKVVQSARSSNAENSAISQFDIRLDQNPIVLEGRVNDAPSALLSGKVVMCLSNALSIRKVYLTLRGQKQVGWYDFREIGGGIVEEENFFRRRWNFLSAPLWGETVGKGTYEWSFELEVPGDWPESVEGSTRTYISYRLKATIDRGIFNPKRVQRKPLRIIRTPNPSSLECCQSASVEDSWTDKLQYSISVPTRGVVFGSPIRIDFKLIPLVKGMMIKSITTTLVEFTHLRFAKSDRVDRNRRIVATDECKPSDDMETVEIDGQSGYNFHRSIQVPTSLTDCLQSVKTRGIDVRHTLMFDLRLRNPDEHQSKLHTVLPIIIYISPYLAPHEDNAVHGALDPNPAVADVLNATVPPQYGAHLLDQLYSDVPSGYVTPAGGSSGINTPFASSSQAASAEDLVSTTGQLPRGWIPNLLGPRLQPLTKISSEADQGHRRQFSAGKDSPSGGELAPPAAVAPLAAETPLAVENPSAVSTTSIASSSAIANTPPTVNTGGSAAVDFATTPTHVGSSSMHTEFSTEALCKVPSYTTARNSQPPARIDDGLPDYESVIQDKDKEKEKDEGKGKDKEE